MSLIQIIHSKGIVVLRARSSELLILPQHVKELKNIQEPKKFSTYFNSTALINRPARKLFESWLRKDKTIWPRLYKVIHEEIKAEDFASDNKDEPAKEEKSTSTNTESAKKSPAS